MELKGLAIIKRAGREGGVVRYVLQADPDLAVTYHQWDKRTPESHFVIIVKEIIGGQVGWSRVPNPKGDPHWWPGVTFPVGGPVKETIVTNARTDVRHGT